MEHGVLTKELYQAHPPRYEYTLTEAGFALHPVLLALKEWGDRYVTEGEPPTVFRHDCGAVLHPRTVCDACSRPVPADTTRAIRIGGVPQHSGADAPDAPSPTGT